MNKILILFNYYPVTLDFPAVSRFSACPDTPGGYGIAQEKRVSSPTTEKIKKSLVNHANVWYNNDEKKGTVIVQ